MRAAVLHSIEDSKFDLRDDVVAVGPGPGQVKIRIRATGVCHSDLSARNGGLPQPLPAILGHEAAGDVIAVGDGVAGLAAGDRVIASWLPPCGTCPSCLRGQPYLCMTHVIAAYVEPRFLVGDTPAFGLAGCGAFAEEMVVSAEGAVKFPGDVPYEVAALVGCGVMTGVGAVFNAAQVEPGATVAVIGCGGVGLSAVNGAALAGAERIIAIDTVASKLELARELGATDTLNASNADPVKAVRDMTGGGVHYSFEALGTKTTAEQAFGMLRPGGTATIIGMVPLGVKIELHGYDFLRDRKLQGTSMGGNRFRVDMPRLLSLWRQGRLKLDHLISGRIKLGQINEGFAALKSGAPVRQLIDFAA